MPTNQPAIRRIYIRLRAEGGNEITEVPLSRDRLLPLTTVRALYLDAIDIKYENKDTGLMTTLNKRQGFFFPPRGGWSSHTFIASRTTNPKRLLDLAIGAISKTAKQRIQLDVIENLKPRDFIENLNTQKTMPTSENWRKQERYLHEIIEFLGDPTELPQTISGIDELQEDLIKMAAKFNFMAIAIEFRQDL